jgi:hypothetical protein
MRGWTCGGTETACPLGVANLGHPHGHGGDTVRHLVSGGMIGNLIEHPVEMTVQAIDHLVPAPEELLQVLHPFEVADDDPAGIAQNIQRAT